MLLLVLVCCAYGSYGYKYAITIPAASASENLTNFPVLVSGTYSWLATTANGGRLQNASGYDVDFFSDSGLTTQLSWQRVSHNLTTGAVQLYVKVTLSSTVDTVIYVGVGDTGVSADQSDGAAAWDSNFKGVWHMEEDPSTVGATDSTASGYTLTSAGSMTSGDSVSGKIGNAVDLDGSNDYLYVTKANGASLNITGALTISAWAARFNGAPVANEGVATIWWNYTGYTNKRQYMLGLNGSQQVQGYISNDGTNNKAANGTADIVDGSWKHLALVYVPSTSLTLYVDGVQVAQNTTSIPASLYSSTGMFAVGAQMDPANGSYVFYGQIDEVRVSNTNRSAAWVAAEYSNMNAPGSFYSVGTEEAVSSARKRFIVVN